MTFSIPTAYVPGYEAARRVAPELAETYIRHTTVGDVMADAVVEQLAESTEHPGQDHEIIKKALDNSHDLPKDTPQVMRDFVESAKVLPDWYERELAMVASRAFLRNTDKVLTALVAGAIVEGFSSMISKSFFLRSRVTSNGVRRLKQNLLQLVDQYLPGGIEPGGDGWKLTLRARLVHAQSRRLFVQSPELWDQSVYGMPLSAAHLQLSSSSFSGRLMQHCAKVGGNFTELEKEAYVHVWRYTAMLFGAPEAIVFRNYAESKRLFEIGMLCEPAPGDEAIIMANSIVNSAPVVVGITDPQERQKIAKYVYQVSRELIGNDRADKLNYPPGRKLRKELIVLRILSRAEVVLNKLVPWFDALRSQNRFNNMLEVTYLNRGEISYKLPTSVLDEYSRDW